MELAVLDWRYGGIAGVLVKNSSNNTTSQGKQNITNKSITDIVKVQ